MTPTVACQHETNVRREGGRAYEYCEGCGATRRAPQPGRRADKWHVCDLCRLRRQSVYPPTPDAGR